MMGRSPTVASVTGAAGRNVVGRSWRFCRAKPLSGVAAAIILVLALVAIFAGPIANYNPNKTAVGHLREAPSRSHLMGTDDLGRDVFSRIVFGTRISLYVALVAVGLGATAGGISGVVSGALGERWDLLFQRVVDVWMSFPTLVLAIALVSALGASLDNVVAAVSIVAFPQAARVTRSVALSVRETDYILAARAVGATQRRVIFLHVLPNCVAPWIIQATTMLGWAVIIEASLSFLGLGPPPPASSWGRMLSDARPWMEVAPWLAIFPGLAISVLVYAFSLLGDGLRDYWDPRLRR